MPEDKVVKYLNNIVNRVENIEELIKMYMDTTSSRAGSIFIKDGKTNKYKCIKHISLDHEHTEVKFEPLTICHMSTDPECGYIAPYQVCTILVIPITIRNKCLGIVCLVNSQEGYNEEIVNILSPYIAITQLIIENPKLRPPKYIKKVVNDSQDLFLANMSHEIRTPANGVIGYGQLLMQTQLTSTQRGYLQSQNQCCIQLMQIINDILDFSKLSSGKMGINTQCFSISEIVEAVQSTMGQNILEKKQKIRFVVDNTTPEYIILDKQKLIQILINLTSNAHKFTDIGGCIDINFYVINEGELSISVKDNGIGISNNDQTKLFSAFEQIKSSLCKTGTGLGLAISKKLAKLLGGDINIESTLGVGSSFIVTAVFKPYEEHEKRMERDAKLLKDKVILVVDDNADNRILLTEMLFEWEAKPVVCASALEALRMVMGNRYKFSLGLIDICMPGTTGSELAKQIKEERPFFPLIALSSIDSFITTQEFEQRLDKPINKIQLFNAIHHILSKKQTPSAYIGDEEESSDSDTPSEHFDINVKILIVEDIVYNRNMLESMIEFLKYKHVQTAEDGQIAFDMLEKAQQDGEPFNIILLDLRMPIMDGYDVIKAIKQKGWTLPNIIVVTASAMEEDRVKCKKEGVKYFITKPIQMSQLKNVLLHVTEIHR